MSDVILNAIIILMLAVYGISLLFILVYSLIQINLVYLYRKSRRKERQLESVGLVETRRSEYPFVTVQLPIYNEFYVAKRIIEAVVAFDYPSCEHVSARFVNAEMDVAEKGFDHQNHWDLPFLTTP